MIYCLSCKKPTKDVNIEPKVTKTKSHILQLIVQIVKD